jgi:hypothetical protein
MVYFHARIWKNFGGKMFVYFMPIWLFRCNLVYFSPFWYIVSRKLWQPRLNIYIPTYVDQKQPSFENFIQLTPLKCRSNSHLWNIRRGKLQESFITSATATWKTIKIQGWYLSSWHMETSEMTTENTGLPDGPFSDQKSQFGYISGDLGMETVVYIHVFWSFGVHILRPLGMYMLCAFGNFIVIWYIFPRFCIVPREIWQPWSGPSLILSQYVSTYILTLIHANIPSYTYIRELNLSFQSNHNRHIEMHFDNLHNLHLWNLCILKRGLGHTLYELESLQE